MIRVPDDGGSILYRYYFPRCGDQNGAFGAIKLYSLPRRNLDSKPISHA